MTVRIQQLIAGVAFGAAVASVSAIVAPQVFAGSNPAVSDVAAIPASEMAPIATVPGDDTAVDMNHWQETAAPVPTPYVPGPRRKK